MNSKFTVQALFDAINSLTRPAQITTAVTTLWLILIFVAWCRIFIKAYQPWWKLLIPIYGTYSTYEIADCEVICWFTLLMSVIFMPLITLPIMDYLPIIFSAQIFQVSIELPAICIAFITFYSIMLSILHIVYCVCLANSFGKSWWFALGLLLLYPIFILILGFDNSKYTFGTSPEKASLKKEAF